MTNISSTASGTILHDNSTNDTINLLSEIMTYFTDRGFQAGLVSSFLEREVHLDLKTDTDIMFDFMEERQQLNPIIFVGIEGSGVSGVTSGEDKRLLIEWGLTEEAANELRSSVSDDLWSKQILYHWLIEWVHNPWGSFTQMGFDTIFYDEKFPRNQWNNYDRRGGPQMFASSYDEIATKIDEILSNNTKVTNSISKNTTQRVFFHATNYQSAQAISKNGINLPQCRHSLDFGSVPSFYLNPSIDNAIEWIKDWRGFNGIVVYWVDIEKIQSMKYRDLGSDDDLWKEVVVASRCGQDSAVDEDDFVYGYQLSNPRQIRLEWADHGGQDVIGSWKNVIPNAQPIRHLQLAVKTRKAANLMNRYCVGVIYFHTS